MDHISSLHDALIGSRHLLSNTSEYLSPEEAALDIALIAYDAGWTPEQLKQALLTLEDSQNSSKLRENIDTLVGVAGLALAIYAQFFSPASSAERPPQVQQEQVQQAYAACTDGSPFKDAYRQPTPEEIATYFRRYEMRKNGELLRRPAPSKKGPYFEESVRGK